MARRRVVFFNSRRSRHVTNNAVPLVLADSKWQRVPRGVALPHFLQIGRMVKRGVNKPANPISSNASRVDTEIKFSA